ncbi:hypothetical protein QZH41_005303 [Actinostola sp. cb2023]|nr:hypothetical protein QZH41_005303 [Actinostola sp. cb2023]
MSQSTENLLKHSDIDDSVDNKHNIISSEKKSAKEGSKNGVSNAGFVGDVNQNKQDDIYGSHETLHSTLNTKRATSFQQKPSTSTSSSSRRHSSPDGSTPLKPYGKHRTKHGLSKHRLTSASEEDLRRKAFLNSMKAERKFQSISHLPSSVQDDERLSVEQKGENVIKDNSDAKNVENAIDSVIDDSKSSVAARQPNSLPSSPRQRGQEHYDQDKGLQRTVVALERAQLEQYKRRLTRALSERAKLTEQLQLLSTNLSQDLQNDMNESSPRSRLGVSPRQVQNTITPRYPALRDVEDGTGERCLPALPAKRKAPRMQIEKLNLEQLDSSRLSEPTYSVRIIDGNHEDNSRDDLTPKGKENLSKASDDIWQKHASGDVFANEVENAEKENETEGKDSRTKDENNNGKKIISVEEFLASDDLENKQANKEQLTQYDDNDKEIRRVLEGTSRYSPELYEPLLYDDGRQKKTHGSVKDEKQYQTNTLVLQKDDKSKHYNEDYELLRASTLRVGSDTAQRKHGHPYEEMASGVFKPDNYHSRNYARLTQRNSRLFNYMTPPGTIRTGLSHSQQNTLAIRGSQGGQSTRQPERTPSNISEKLRYYREVLDDRNEDYTSRDLADACANEKDPEKRRAIQQEAAAEAAMLRREASIRTGITSLKLFPLEEVFYKHDTNWYHIIKAFPIGGSVLQTCAVFFSCTRIDVVKRQLSIDDFSHYGDAYSPGSHGDAFSNLKVAMDRANSSVVLPSVDTSSTQFSVQLEDVIKAMITGQLIKVTENELNSFVARNYKLDSTVTNVFLVNLHPVQSRSSDDAASAIFKQNDEAIAAVTKQISQLSPSYTCILTASAPNEDVSNELLASELSNLPHDRLRRAVIDDAKNTKVSFLNGSMFVNGDCVLMYMSGLVLQHKNQTYNFFNMSDINGKVDTIQCSNTSGVNMTLELNIGKKAQVKVTLGFKFLRSTTDWKCNSIEFTMKGKENLDFVLPCDKEVQLPRKMSYHCYNSTFKNANYSLQFSNFQVQPYDVQGSKFSYAYDCVGFFSIPILMGLFTTGILLVILFMGIMAVFSITTMDRFDDPKGSLRSFGATTG